MTQAVSIVIPALDEAANLPHVLPQLPRDAEVIVVDGGSTDDTIDVARSLRPDALIVRQFGRGKGDALLHGFRVARGDVIVTLDADCSTEVGEIPLFLQALEAADFVKGSRFLPGGGSDDITMVRRLGNRFLTTVVNVLYGTRYTDLCYGFNAFRRDCLAYMPREADGFEIETMMHICMVRSGVRVLEVPSHERARQHGFSKLSAFRDGFRILRTILRARLERAPHPVIRAQHALPAKGGSSGV